MKHVTACPLDCYDSCGIIFENDSIKAIKDGYTAGFLCPHLNYYRSYETISSPRYKGKDISLSDALLKLKEMILSSSKSELLHYRGNGNFGLMQEVTDHFFASYGGTLTDGSLCDGAGEAGIIEGRGSNKNMSLSEIEKSEVVIVWGRNPHTTSSHLLPILRGKTIIVIDPIKTKIAKSADLHIQIKPHGDLYLAMLLTRFLHIEGRCDEDFLKKYGSEFEEFYELTQTIRIKATLEEIDVTLGEIGTILSLVKDKKVAIVCGVGIQKYSDGADVLRSIDAFAVAMGLFGKEGCGVAYLGDSKEGIKTPFNTKAKRVSKVDTDFSKYKTVFIQGANPLSQMPNTLRVKETISRLENLVYFGLYENETSELADLVIPAKNFLSKNDIRTSYSHNLMMNMPKVQDCDTGISEYDLSAFLCKEFGVELESESFYIEAFKNFSIQRLDGFWYVEFREDTAYKDGFDTDDGEFIFIDEIEPLSKSDGKLYLLSPKSQISLNSQFKREKAVHLHSSLGFKEDENVLVSSKYGTLNLKVKNNDELRKDCALIYSSTPGVNNLTASNHSMDGKCAVYQEEKVIVESLIQK